MNRKKQKEHFNDLLIPILLVLCVMPFIIHLAEYSCGYSKYLWYAENDTIQDLYCYYRSYFFEVIAVITLAVLVFRMGLYKESRKPWKIFLPLGIYAVMTVVSTGLSVNVTASTSGNFYQFQNVFVILGYLVMCFYTYQILELEKDYRTIWRGLQIAFLLLAVVGVFQLFKIDLLNFTWVQRLVMSAEQFEIYAGEIENAFTGNNVYLTLFNPNYAGIFLVMLVCIFGVMFYSETERRKKIFAGVLTVLAFIFMWFTYSRVTLVALFIGIVAFLFLLKGKIRNVLKYLIPGVVLLLAVLLLVDGWNDWKYMSRIVDTRKESSIQEMMTTEDGIELVYDGQTYRITIEEGAPAVYDSKQQVVSLKEDDGDFVLELSEPIHMMVVDMEEEYLYLYIEEYTYAFGQDDTGYYYLNENGNADQLVEISKVDFGGYEYLGSGRLYIWSRVLPMLKDYLLVGSGPDTFAEVFPQNDYVGKAVYADTSARIMEKPHNDYLLQWVQSGFIGFVGMLIFYILFLKEGFKRYRNINLDTMKSRLGMGCFLACICYMVSSLFNDSTLFTTPVFWVFAGIALSAVNKSAMES